MDGVIVAVAGLAIWVWGAWAVYRARQRSRKAFTDRWLAENTKRLTRGERHLSASEFAWQEEQKL